LFPDFRKEGEGLGLGKFLTQIVGESLQLIPLVCRLPEFRYAFIAYVTEATSFVTSIGIDIGIIPQAHDTRQEFCRADLKALVQMACQGSWLIFKLEIRI
jgi:hypothetical protein